MTHCSSIKCKLMNGAFPVLASHPRTVLPVKAQRVDPGIGAYNWHPVGMESLSSPDR